MYIICYVTYMWPHYICWFYKCHASVQPALKKNPNLRYCHDN